MNIQYALGRIIKSLLTSFSLALDFWMSENAKIFTTELLVKVKKPEKSNGTEIASNLNC